MASVNISPLRVLLTSGQTATFEASDSNGQLLQVSWTITPAIGGFVPPVLNANAQTSSVTFAAPSQVSGAQAVAIVASTANGSAGATISLVPNPIATIPAKVDLEGGQCQQFIALAAGVPAADSPNSASVVKWILSPSTGLGSIDEGGLYQAPDSLKEPATVTVTAAMSDDITKQATSTVNLIPPPWKGIGLNLLGIYLIFVFALVALIIALWPPSLPSADTARAERLEADKIFQNAMESYAKGSTDHIEQVPNAGDSASDNLTKASKATNTKASVTIPSPTQPAADPFKIAKDNLQKKQAVENQVASPYVDVSLVNHLNRDVDFILLVLLGGALGSFLHIGQSYSEFVGNRQLKSSWGWWYGLAPFIGAGLALVFYTALRGGFLALNGGSSIKTSDLSAYAVVSLSALVGMFSKAATVKLGEVFDTLFKSDKAKESKDPLTGSIPETSASIAHGSGVSPRIPDGTVSNTTIANRG
jgi:hypothetical protein